MDLIERVEGNLKSSPAVGARWAKSQRATPKLTEYLAVSVFLFVVSSTLGFYVGLVNPWLSEQLIEALRSSVEPTQEALMLLALILLNNASKCLGAIMLGLLFGLAPLIFDVVNGFILGLLAVASAKVEAAPFSFLVKLAPHGALEVPAMLFSVAVGLREGVAMIKKLRGEEVSLKEEAKQGLKLFVRLVLPLLLSAAVIEVFLTPLIVSLILG
jgi:stage II sporulation protein M